MSNYTSSIINKYGDKENVKNDAKTLNDILSRQGTSLLIDVIAEHVGNIAAKYELGSHEVNNLKGSINTELFDAMNERT